MNGIGAGKTFDELIFSLGKREKLESFAAKFCFSLTVSLSFVSDNEEGKKGKKQKQSIMQLSWQKSNAYLAETCSLLEHYPKSTHGATVRPQ